MTFEDIKDMRSKYKAVGEAFEQYKEQVKGYDTVKKTWIIIHEYDVDGGFGDAITQEEILAVVRATEKEKDDFLDTYNNPYVYDVPYAELMCHGVRMELVDHLCDISELNPLWVEDKLSIWEPYYDEEKEDDE